MRIIILIECLLFTSLLLSQKVKDVTHVAYTVSDTEQAVDFLKQNVNATVNSTKHIEGIELQRLFGLRDEGLSLKVTSMQIGSDELRFWNSIPSCLHNQFHKILDQMIFGFSILLLS